MADPEKPFFSVIVPVYNRESLIGPMIQSVLDQQFEDFELIIVDDGSTDNTESSVKSFSDPRIQYIKIKNSERGAARNTGAGQARGSYFNFFDSDDSMYTHHLKAGYQFIQENNSPGWFHVGYDVTDESGRILGRENGAPEHPEKRLIVTNYLGCNSVFIERSLFQENKFNADRRMASSEDWELWLRVISRQNLLTCKEVTFRIIHHANRSLLTISPSRVIERDVFMLEQLLLDNAFVKKFKNDLPLFEADRYTFFSLSLILVKRRKETIAYLWKSIRATPKALTRKRFWACLKLLLVSLVK